MFGGYLPTQMLDAATQRDLVAQAATLLRQRHPELAVRPLDAAARAQAEEKARRIIAQELVHRSLPVGRAAEALARRSSRRWWQRAPGVLTAQRARQRCEEIEEDLPEALASLAANARLVHDFGALLCQAAEDVRQRGARPLAALLDEAAVRLRERGPEEAFRALGQAAPSAALRSLALRLSVAARSGGPWPELLEEAARRQRRRLEGVARARAKAAGAVGLANLLLLLAFAVVGLMVLSGQESRAFFTAPGGQLFLGVVAGVMALGRLWIQALVSEVR